MPQIANYTVGLRFNPDKRSIVLMDRQLKQFEKNLIAMQARIQKTFAKSFVLPALTVKKFNFDSLALQRGAQMELNRVGRLLEMKVSNIKIDQSKINSQVQNVFQRAANNARMNVKSIAGTAGGGHPYQMPGYAPLNQGGGGFSPNFIGMPRIGGAGMLAGGGLAAGAFMAAGQVNDARQLISKRELQRLQLEISVGGSKERRQSSADVLIDLSNRLGIEAEGQISGFTKFMKQGQLSMKLSAQKAFDLYSHMAIATRGNGGDQQSIERQAYALQQIGGLGYLRAEELNQQLSDSAPAIRSYIIGAFEERTGKKGVEAFLKAMSQRQVTFDDVMRGYAAAAKDASGKTKELANSIQGEQARFANLKFTEELERSKGPMTDAARQLAQSQQELYQAMEPLRDSFYRLAAASTSLTARFVSSAAKQLSQSPAFKGTASPAQLNTEPMASSMGRGLLSVPDIRRLPDVYSPRQPFISPLVPKNPEWKAAADAYQMPSLQDIQRQMQQNITSNVNVQSGAVVVHTNAQNADQLATELSPHIQGIFRREFQSTLHGIQIENGNLE